MKKHNLNKPPITKLKRVTKSTLKNYTGGYKSILPVAVFTLLLTIFVSINSKLIPDVNELPQTGDSTSQQTFDVFANNAQKFIASTEGTIFLILFFISLITFFVFIASTGFPRRK